MDTNKDADILKGVQRRTTKMIPSLRNLSYKERLKRLGMFYPREEAQGWYGWSIQDDSWMWQGKSREAFLYNEDEKTRKQFMFKN